MRSSFHRNHAETFRIAGDFAHGEDVNVASAIDDTEFGVVGDHAEKFQAAPYPCRVCCCLNAGWRLRLRMQGLRGRIADDDKLHTRMYGSNVRQRPLDEFAQTLACGQTTDRQQQQPRAQTMPDPKCCRSSRTTASYSCVTESEPQRTRGNPCRQSITSLRGSGVKHDKKRPIVVARARCVPARSPCRRFLSRQNDANTGK